ncbi:hypothetical protein SELMODRAFT_270353 [Selaginella moellendorffii]|uniref:RING-type domain-containing protein n=1 Tax=Selaginella moellendorffii TaxID=88036 RepID=D8QXN1_SELML|nr:E3 ubiquitin-protein ligase AIRP2 [Selaginella moellendorffii]XP_024524219.1 E3 ubiquitin-protein ligase AIRP2 [Selaginella moellendorffii]EFJ17317.1 hypothetical protein SELMODRAFT_154535 [Selaginella moellendorffii]EFJ35452.1 hypothetical protein SELMODRAFT_270353 [Selaginella moellendorffii]|eukprot:XP_002981502.1 E3 ubiquitin-protein ligase AIRP2 [Selaginella moellendorffii]
MCLLLGYGKSFKESLKALEADIQHANTLALDYPREYDGVCLQMRLSYSPAAHFFLFLFQWADCSLAGALGLLRILIYKVLRDGTTTMSTYERKASLREFYAYIYPSLQQLPAVLSEAENSKQKSICIERSKKKEEERLALSDIDLEREHECNICMETSEKIVLPGCGHSMCIQCFRDWNLRAKSCPFCRDSLKRVNSRDLWIVTDNSDLQDMVTFTRDNLQRLYMYIDKLPLLVSDSVLAAYDAHLK